MTQYSFESKIDIARMSLYSSDFDLGDLNRFDKNKRQGSSVVHNFFDLPNCSL